MERIRLRTPSAQCLEDVTAQIADAVRRSGVEEGVCHLFVPHTTAGLVINENADPAVGRDLLDSSLVGQSSSAPVTGGRLALGRWQGVFLAEFDGPRERELQVTVVAAGVATQAETASKRGQPSS